MAEPNQPTEPRRSHVDDMEPMVARATRLMGMHQHWRKDEREGLESGQDARTDFSLPEVTPEEVAPVAPVKQDGCISDWECDISGLGGRNRSWMMPQLYGGKIGQIQPILFRDGKPLRVIILQIKGGTGRTTHALGLASTAAVDGAELFVRATIWECLRQTGLRPFFRPHNQDGATDPIDRHLETAAIKIVLERSKDKLLTNSLNVAFAPDRVKDMLTSVEAAQLYQVLKATTQLLFIDSGPVDLRSNGPGAELLRGILLDDQAYVLIPWTHNWASWHDADEIVTQLEVLGVSRRRCWGITTEEPDRRHPLGVSLEQSEERFVGQLAVVPYLPLVLEQSMAQSLLPIFMSPTIRSAYRGLLGRMVSSWLEETRNSD